VNFEDKWVLDARAWSIAGWVEEPALKLVSAVRAEVSQFLGPAQLHLVKESAVMVCTLELLTGYQIDREELERLTRCSRQGDKIILTGQRNARDAAGSRRHS
jgi:hypothetical protein